MVAALPDDLLAEVLRRLAPRSLAACRCVCKPWRDLVDERRLLRADLLPHSLAGIFINFSGLFYPEFFARPSTTISGRLDFLPFGTKYYNVEDHCNGLLLLDLYDCYCVVNPATRWWARLPPRPPLLDEMETDHIHTVYLVFDPAASPNYEVFVIPCIQNWRIQVEQEPSECPPSVYVLSSRTERWEERTFVREGEAARTGIVPDMRISLRNDQYQVIKLPKVTRMPLDEYFYLGRSQKGVH
uniref:F-box domain-containing protein n=1 Tax=Oryza punctata TaxID=4537 RepID=A0A0E0KH80_ORYPU